MSDFNGPGGRVNSTHSPVDKSHLGTIVYQAVITMDLHKFLGTC